MKKWAYWPLAAVILLSAGAYFGSPWLAVANLRKAAESGDRRLLERTVDFPHVREGLKAQLAARITKEMSESPELKDNPFGGLGTLMAPLIVDRWVDSLVTADGVAEMIRAGRVNNPQIDPEPPPAENDHKPTSTLTDFRYLSLDEFLVSVKEAESDPDPLKLSFERRGLVSWKLVRIDLPMPDEKKTAGPE